jgi:hypothetical protein
MSTITKIVEVSAEDYADADDSLLAAATAYANTHGCDLRDVDAAWSDDARTFIMLSVPMADDSDDGVNEHWQEADE